MYVNAFHPKTTRNSLVVEQVGFIVHCCKRDCTPWRTWECLDKRVLERIEDLYFSWVIWGEGLKKWGFSHSGLDAIRRWG